MRRRPAVAPLALGLILVSAGCSLAPVGDAPGGAGGAPMLGNGSSGSLRFGLSVAGGVSLNALRYALSGPNDFTSSGSIDLGNSTRIATTIGGLPVGRGFTITLSGTSVDGSLQCSGSAGFDVTPDATSSVDLPVECSEISVNGTVNLCPVIDDLTTSPAEALVGSSLGLSALAHDGDNGPLPFTYRWTATSGRFDDPSAANTRFTCMSAGNVTLTLTVSDGDPNPTCAATQTTDVTCTASASGGAGGTGSGTGGAGGTGGSGTVVPAPALPGLGVLGLALGLGLAGARRRLLG